MKDLKELLAHEVQDLYAAETQLIQALPRFAEVVKSSKLKQTFNQQVGEAQRQKDRLGRVAEIMQIKAENGPSEGMGGLLRASERISKAKADPAVRDAALIGVAQKVEHYQIAGYGTACTYAKLIGQSEIADLLGKSLDEAKTTDQKLTSIAMDQVNVRAMA